MALLGWAVLGYKVTENYANIKAIWDKLDINQIDRPYKIAADLKMANILFGLMSHSSCHPCTCINKYHTVPIRH